MPDPQPFGQHYFVILHQEFSIVNNGRGFACIQCKSSYYSDPMFIRGKEVIFSLNR